MEIDLLRPFNKSAKILIVGDSDTDITPLKGLLEKEGYEKCTGISDPRHAVAQFLADPPHLLLLDWHMDLLSGEEVLLRIKKQVTEEEMPPVLIITPDMDPDIKRQALKLGGTTDFLTKPLDYVEVLLRIRNLLHLRMLHIRVQSENTRLEKKVRKRTLELERSVLQLKESQNQIIQQERLHALGAMAGGVAHDFNNALTVILGFGDLFLHSSDDEIRKEPAKVRESLEVITRAANDAVEIVRRLGEFYRPHFMDKNDRVKVSVNTICEEAAQLCEPKWLTQKRSEGIFIDLQTELGEVPEIAAAPSELREMLMNLIFNAVDAMPQGGRILLRTGVEENYAVIAVEDSGTGMTEETRNRCMEPFYTTKGDKGTGLGLAIIYGIVRRHQGLIRISTELNKGTKFTILLPATEINAEMATGEILAPRINRHLKILVVDDNADVCQVISSYLEEDEHTVVLAENGVDALEKFNAEKFDLVITDRAMPKMSGDQLATAIKEIDPIMPIILLTGFSEQNQEPVVHADTLLGKPISLNSIRAAINKVVMQEPAANIEVPAGGFAGKPSAPFTFI